MRHFYFIKNGHGLFASQDNRFSVSWIKGQAHASCWDTEAEAKRFLVNRLAGLACEVVKLPSRFSI